MSEGCVFCRIIAGEAAAHIVDANEGSIAFLDRRPVFLGHVLVVPRDHHETLAELPVDRVGDFFTHVKRLASAVEQAMEAKGTFVAMNNRVSQSVPHLHVHIVPRRPKDGLRGFFWPRVSYPSEEAMEQVRANIEAAIASGNP